MGTVKFVIYTFVIDDIILLGRLVVLQNHIIQIKVVELRLGEVASVVESVHVLVCGLIGLSRAVQLVCSRKHEVEVAAFMEVECKVDIALLTRPR